MANYTITTQFAPKDALPTGDAGKVIKGTEFATEFTNIAQAISEKADLISPEFTGTPTVPTAALNDNSTKIASTAFVQQEINYAVAAGTEGLDGVSIAQLQVWKRSATAPATPTGGSFSFDTLILTPPTDWSRNVPSGTDPVYVSSASASITGTTGTDSTLSWSTPVLAFQNGNDGSGTDTKTVTGYLYYSLASTSAPSPLPTPADTNTYNFSTGTFSVVKANWTTLFSSPSPVEGRGFWAVNYSVTEDELGNQTINIGTSAFRWFYFDGLVTFTNFNSTVNDGSTVIDGGRIETGTLSCDRLEANTQSTLSTGKVFGLATDQTVASATKGVGFFKALSTAPVGTAGVVALSEKTSGIGAATTAVGVGAGNFYHATSNSYTSFNTKAEIATPDYAGIFTRYSGGSAAEIGIIGTAGYDFYAFGTGTNYGPFTGSHDALLAKNTAIEVGDIVVDTNFSIKKNVSNTISKVERSNTANQKGVLGVFVAINNDHKPNTLSSITSENDTYTVSILPEYQQLLTDNDVCSVNAVGEGQINVCGEGGSIEVGDLIVTSSMAGKGMKQADDIIRGYTVAKARESVTFTSADEVKQIACIYVAG